MVNLPGDWSGAKAPGFAAPTQAPRDDEQHRTWQEANKTWWESAPMRYDWGEAIAAAPGTREYFEEIDSRFLSSVRKYMPWREIPFDPLVSFERLRQEDVLEIGVGHGTHAQLLAPRSRSFAGIDLTDAAAAMTRERFRLFGLPGTIQQMDAERMVFADASFDFIWSWGVIHHSADTGRVLGEMHRVLRPGGRATVMIYYRSWWSYYLTGYLRGLLQGKFRSKGGLHDVAQDATDGAIARYYSIADWQDMTRGLFEVERTRIYGLKIELVPLPRGSLKSRLEAAIPDALARRLLSRLRMGSFVVAHMVKA